MVGPCFSLPAWEVWGLIREGEQEGRTEEKADLLLNSPVSVRGIEGIREEDSEIKDSFDSHILIVCRPSL